MTKRRLTNALTSLIHSNNGFCHSSICSCVCATGVVDAGVVAGGGADPSLDLDLGLAGVRFLGWVLFHMIHRQDMRRRQRVSQNVNRLVNQDS